MTTFIQIIVNLIGEKILLIFAAKSRFEDTWTLYVFWFFHQETLYVMQV